MVIDREQSGSEHKRKLEGITLVVTRPANQASGLIGQLQQLGARVIACPTIGIFLPDDDQPLIQSILSLADYDWIVFTSVNGVTYFTTYCKKLGRNCSTLGAELSINIAAIGPATAAEAEKCGYRVAVQPSEYRAESLIETFRQKHGSLAGLHFLLPRADRARPTLSEGLQRLGASVTDVVAYATKTVEHLPESCREQLQRETIDLVLFTSSSTVDSFLYLLEQEEITFERNSLKAASIGPITSQTLLSHGIKPILEAREYTIPGLVSVIAEHYDHQSD